MIVIKSSKIKKNWTDGKKWIKTLYQLVNSFWNNMQHSHVSSDLQIQLIHQILQQIWTAPTVDWKVGDSTLETAKMFPTS